MNIRSTLRSSPKLEKAVADGSLVEPSVVLRTPGGHHDLLLTRRAYADPNLRRLLLPIKSLVQTALNQVAPQFSGVVDGVSVIIDLTIKTAVAIDKLPSGALHPVDAMEPLSEILQSANVDDETVRQERLRQIFHSGRKPQGIIRMIASFDDDRANESISSLEVALGETPLVGEIIQIGDGLISWLDTKAPTNSLAVTNVDPALMQNLIARLSQS